VARAGLLLLAIAGTSGSLAACDSDFDPVGVEPISLSVLFVGNSLTYRNGLPRLVLGLFEQIGRTDVASDFVAFPGFGLEDHWEEGAVLEEIASGRWDLVVMQQGPSATEGRPSLLSYSQLFDERIRAAGARPAMYMVWPAEVRSFDFDGVLDSYRTAAETINGLFFPCGEAWRIAWAEDPTLDLYDTDRFHPSLLGSYLAALVIFEQLSGTDLATLPPRIRRGAEEFVISPDIARVLQRAASEANRRHARVVER